MQIRRTKALILVRLWYTETADQQFYWIKFCETLSWKIVWLGREYFAAEAKTQWPNTTTAMGTGSRLQQSTTTLCLQRQADANERNLRKVFQEVEPNKWSEFDVIESNYDFLCEKRRHVDFIHTRERSRFSLGDPHSHVSMPHNWQVFSIHCYCHDTQARL